MAIFGRKVHVTETPDVRHITNPDVMHEESDVSVRGVALFVFGLAVFGLITCGVIYGLFRYFEAREARNEDKEFHSPMARLPEERQPAAGVPHLQGAPGDRALDAPDAKDSRYDLQLKSPDEEWHLLRQKYDWDLTHYGTPDPSTGMVRVPVDDAIERLLQKGLPARPAQPNAPSVLGGIDVPSYSSAGRQTEKRDGGEQ
jgi:hypothetical protein